MRASWIATAQERARKKACRGPPHICRRSPRGERTLEHPPRAIRAIAFSPRGKDRMRGDIVRDRVFIAQGPVPGRCETRDDAEAGFEVGMETNFSPEQLKNASHQGGGGDRAGLRPLRPVHGDVPLLSHAGRRARQPARADSISSSRCSKARSRPNRCGRISTAACPAIPA